MALARKQTLSPSKLTTYLACPAKYKWTHVDVRGKWFLRSKSYYSFGSSLHGVLQRFHDSSDVGVTTTDEAVAALEESWIEAGYGSQDEMMQALAEGKELLTHHIEEHLKSPVTSKTLYVEKMLRLDLGRFVLVGRLDRVDEHEDGTLEIIDYKSGRSAVTTEDVAGDVAMACYQVLLRSAHPGRVVTASIVALRSDTKATAMLTDEGASELLADLKSIGEEILDRDYEAMTPVGKRLCLNCDFIDLCASHPDFQMPTADQE